MVICVALLVYGIQHIVGLKTHNAIFALGIGTIHFETLISSITPSQGTNGLISNALVANAPQLILSVLYFAMNGVLTCMVSGQEWSEFAYQRKGLRVSNRPAGAQRCTYFLSLPYRYMLPFMGISTILHWLVSQSLFLVVLRTYCDSLTWCPLSAQYGADSGGAAFGMCWSPLGVVLTLVVGTGMAGYVLMLGLRRYKPGLPLAAGNSAVISAACHPTEHGSYSEGYVGAEMSVEGERLLGEEKMPLQWGVTGRLEDLKSEEIWHCAFTAGRVGLPEEGQIYA